MTGWPSQGPVLAIHPTSRGFGWAALDQPLAPHRGELVEVSGDKNANALRRIENLIEALQPCVVVLEAFEAGSSRRRDRIKRLGRAIVALAGLKGVEVRILSRLEVQQSFAAAGARSRREIAIAVAQHLPALRERLPPERKAWSTEDRRMALFAAAALVLTYFEREAREVLDERRGA